MAANSPTERDAPPGRPRDLGGPVPMSDPTPRKCSRCPCAASPSNTICSRCRKKKPCPLQLRVRQDTEKGAPGTNGRARSAAPPLAPYQPFAGQIPDGLEAKVWPLPYLRALGELGRHYVAANAAGVRPRDVRALKREHPDFARECKVAHGYHSDVVEIRLAHSQQVAGPIVVMKRRRPGHFLEPALIQQTVNVANINQAGAAPPDLAAILEKLTGRLSAQEIAAMRGEIVDADVLALPPKPEEPQ